MDYLLGLRDRMEHAKGLLTDPPRRPPSSSSPCRRRCRSRSSRASSSGSSDFGIPVGGVIVNMVIDKKGVDEKTPSFVRNRIAMQDMHMEDIRKSFPDVRAVVPLFDQEVRGLPMLRRTAEYLFA